MKCQHQVLYPANTAMINDTWLSSTYNLFLFSRKILKIQEMEKKEVKVRNILRKEIKERSGWLIFTLIRALWFSDVCTCFFSNSLPNISHLLRISSLLYHKWIKQHLLIQSYNQKLFSTGFIFMWEEDISIVNKGIITEGTL